MAEARSSRSLLPVPLMLWLSPAFPIGSFAYSHGLEWAVQAGDVGDAASLAGWLADLLAHGAPRSDAILLAAAWRAAAAGDAAGMADINELALALAGSRERHLETTAQGNAFRAAIEAAWPAPGGGAITGVAGDIAYPVAVAAAAAAHGYELQVTLQASLAASMANLVSATVRLGAIGQTDGQRVMAGLLPAIKDLAAKAACAGLDDLGGCAFGSDIAALRHETQYTRLFRT